TPNPTKDFVLIFSESAFESDLEWQLYNSLGESVLSKILPAGQNHIQTELKNLSEGVYFWQIFNEGKPVFEGKIIIIK
ncbi:MAG: T9SS C-terminal target domain-containing protein, partial [Bacteroidetes bacterium]